MKLKNRFAVYINRKQERTVRDGLSLCWCAASAWKKVLGNQGHLAQPCLHICWLIPLASKPEWFLPNRFLAIVTGTLQLAQTFTWEVNFLIMSIVFALFYMVECSWKLWVVILAGGAKLEDSKSATHVLPSLKGNPIHGTRLDLIWSNMPAPSAPPQCRV